MGQMAGQKKFSMSDDMLNFFMVISGLIVISALVLFITRFQRGIFAFVISGLAILLLVYWLFEFKKTIKDGPVTIRKGKERKEWVYDMISAKDEITFLAEVPGPDNEVKIELKDKKLRVIAPRGFYREVELPTQVEIIDSRCVNGVLNVRFRRVTTSKTH
jgi:HSP20 family molecular chaperone IbpA